MKKKGQYHERRVDADYAAALRGSSHTQLGRQRGLRGTKLGPANEGRSLSKEEREEIVKKMRERGEI